MSESAFIITPLTLLDGSSSTRFKGFLDPYTHCLLLGASTGPVFIVTFPSSYYSSFLVFYTKAVPNQKIAAWARPGAAQNRH